MQQAQISDQIIALTREQLGFSKGDVKRDSHLVADLGADSLDMIELALAVEDEFSVELPDDVVERFATVGDIIDHVSSLVPA